MQRNSQVVAIVKNRYTRFRASGTIVRRLNRLYRYHPTGYEWTDAYRMGHWDGYCYMMCGDRVATGLFLHTKNKLGKKLGVPLKIRDKREWPIYRTDYPENVERNLRDYQKRAVEAMIQSTGGLILQATGTGKTFLAGAYLSRLQEAAIFVVDELTLLKQSHDEIQRMLEDEEVGIIGGGECSPRRITVATVQSLQRIPRKQLNVKPGALILDEVHLSINDRTRSVVRRLRPKAVFGLTATLQMDKPHVWMEATALTGPVLSNYPISQSTREGYTTRGVIVRLVLPLKLEGDDFRSRLSSLVHNHMRNSAIARIARYAQKRGRRIVVLARWIEHVNAIADVLKEHGLNPVTLHGGCPQEDRAQAIRDMEEGKVRCIVASEIFAKGVNIRSLDTVIDASATRSANSCIQRYGRGVRVNPGKRGVLYVDIADEGNPFENAASARLKALKRVGMPIVVVRWKGNSERVFHAAASNRGIW